MAAATIDHRDGKHTTAARLYTAAAHATPSRHAPSGPPVAPIAHKNVGEVKTTQHKPFSL